MGKPLIIQLLGQARAGKDWTAEQLKLAFEAQDKSVAIMSYAAPMKRISATLFGTSTENIDKYKNNPKHYSIWVCTPSNHTVLEHFNFRTFLQRLGHEAMKSEFGNSVWADLMQLQISKYDFDVIIIPDCRFSVELATFPNALTVRIINQSLPHPTNHASEIELIDYVTDFTLDNTGHKLSSNEVRNLAQLILTSK